MFVRLKTSLSKPKLTVFFIKDRFLNVVLYMFLLTIILIIPNILKMIVNNEMDITRKTDLYNTLQEFSDFEIKDGLLILTKQENNYFEQINISLGENYDKMRFNILFLDNDLAFYISDVETKRISYVDLGIDNLVFNKENKDNYHLLTNTLANLLKSEKIINFVDISVNYFLNIMDYIMVSIILVIMMMFFPINGKMTFTNRFKITIYLMSSWVFSQLILKLFNLENLEFISLIVVYIYHAIVYRFLKMVKVEIVDVNK